MQSTQGTQSIESTQGAQRTQRTEGTQRRVVGIDLGTTHTVVAWADERGVPTIFPVPQLVARGEVAAHPLLPSMLYAPLASEALVDELGVDDDGALRFVAGEHARRRGVEVPERAVVSAKSWLCHGAVDRLAPILPWGETEAPKLSPVDAAVHVLRHVRRAWDRAFDHHPLAEQDVLVTVPASFDEVARRLTLLAAERAGLSVRLLEEPQAAFQDFLTRTPAPELAALVRAHGGSLVALVVDVGGGTTDLSTLRLEVDAAGEVRTERLAVGRHLLVGGDNMDLALAHRLEPELAALAGAGERLDPARFAELVLQAREAKERLLGDAPPEAVSVTLLARGARLVSGALTATLARRDAEALVVEGFFPDATSLPAPRARGGLVAFGLPHEREPAITRHVRAFLERQGATGALAPRAVLLNGGVFRSARLAERLLAGLDAWMLADDRGHEPLDRLPNGDPDRAVALGAVAHGLALRGRGPRIGAGSTRAYFVGVGVGAGPSAGPSAAGQSAAPSPIGAAPSHAPSHALCVLARGAREQEPVRVTEGRLALLVGRPARLELFADDTRAPHRVGEVVTLAESAIEPLASAEVRFDEPEPRDPKGRAKKKGRPKLPEGTLVDVQLECELSPVGTVELRCVELLPAGTGAGEPGAEPGGGEPSVGERLEPRVFDVSFDLRAPERAAADARDASSAAKREGSSEGSSERSSQGPSSLPPSMRLPSAKTSARGALSQAKLDAARALIERAMGGDPSQSRPKDAKELTRELEKLFGERDGWSAETARALFDLLAVEPRGRRRSPEHERAYLSLLGFCLRPGFGAPNDAARVRLVVPLFAERVAFEAESRSWQQLFIAFRRIAGGLVDKTQLAMRDTLDPFVAPAEARLKKPKGWRPASQGDLIDLVAWLERAPAARRAELGGWLLERTWTERDGRLWAAIGRVGARVPAYASLHHVVAASVAERWLDHLLREKWDDLPEAPRAAMLLARRTGDRARDLSATLAADVAKRLEKAGAPPRWARAVRDVLDDEEEGAERFGEALPVGLRLVE